MERACSDKEHVVSLDRAVFGVDGAALHDGQDVALHALAGDVRAAGLRTAGDLVDLVDEKDAILLRLVNGLAGGLVHVDELADLFLLEDLARLDDRHLADLLFLGHQPAEHIAEGYIRAGQRIGGRGVLHLDFDDLTLQGTAHQFHAQAFALLFAILPHFRRLVGLAHRAEQRLDGVDVGLLFALFLIDQRVENALLRVLLRNDLHVLAHALLDQAQRGFDQIAHHGIDVSADVADLGKLGGLHLDQRRVHELGQPAGDLGLAHARWADHQDVLWGNILANFRFQATAAIAVAQRDGDSALGLVLTDDVFIQLLDNLPGSELIAVHPHTSSTVMWSLV